MKTFALTIVMLLICSVALAQTTVTLETNLEGGKSLAALYSDNNFFGFAQYCEGGWWQAYAGATYSPTQWSQVALGVGTEADGLRLGGWVWAGQGRYSFLHLFEQGGSGPWHKTMAMVKVNDSLNAGVIDRSFFGHGITAEYQLGGGSKLTGALYEGGVTTLALSHSF
jgi:hypothetical protein